MTQSPLVSLVEITEDKHSLSLGPAVIISPVFVKTAEWKQAAVKKPARQGGGRRGGRYVVISNERLTKAWELDWGGVTCVWEQLGVKFCFQCRCFGNIVAKTLCSCCMFLDWGDCCVKGARMRCWWDVVSMYTLRFLMPWHVKVLWHTLPYTDEPFLPTLGIKFAQVVVASSGRREFELHWHSWHSLCTDLHTSLVWLHMALSLQHTHIHTHSHSSYQFTDTLILPVWDNQSVSGLFRYFFHTRGHTYRQYVPSHTAHMDRRNVKVDMSDCSWWWEGLTKLLI